jgi:hypothetical protein
MSHWGLCNPQHTTSMGQVKRCLVSDPAKGQCYNDKDNEEGQVGG